MKQIEVRVPWKFDEPSKCLMTEIEVDGHYNYIVIPEKFLADRNIFMGTSMHEEAAKLVPESAV